MVDAIKRTLKVPPKYVPYLEKHHIYELLYELTEDIIIERPSDHILSLKQMLSSKCWKNMMSSKVILIAPPYIDMEKLANLISDIIGTFPIKLHTIKTSESKEDYLPNSSPLTIVQCARKILNSELYHHHGWILYDYPRNHEEALALQRTGVIATHVIQLVSSVRENDDDAAYSTTDIKEYNENLPGLKAAYRSALKVCKIKNRTIEQLAIDCAKLVRIPPHRGAPMLPRVLIIGAHGSGRKTQAKLLCHRFNLVHVDFEEIVKQATLGEDSNAEYLKLLTKRAIPISPNMLSLIVNRRLLKADCLYRGWVLTGYPRDVKDFKALDLMETPPNRVVFLNVAFNMCCKRLTERRINMYTGKTYHVSDNPPQAKEKRQIATHPQDYMLIVHDQMSHYEKVKEAMKTYCGLTTTHVNGELSINKVAEMMEAVVIRPAPRTKPRIIESDYSMVSKAEAFIIKKTHRLSDPCHMNIVKL